MLHRINFFFELINLCLLYTSIQGSGQTALAAREAAEMFLHVQDTIGQLMDNSIDFFRNLEETHRMQDVALAKGINGAEGIS